MICPKCSHSQNGNFTECERCGIIFAKFLKIQEDKAQGSVADKAVETAEENIPSPVSFIDLFLYTKDDINIFYWSGRLVIYVVLLWLSCRFVLSPISGNYAGSSVMHLVNLPFHEAGHVFFRPFGSLLTSLGGSVGQLLMPLVCFIALFLQTRDTFGASVALWWFGQNFFDMAPYINDAHSLSLPLLGGNFGHSSPYGFHDWEFILTETGLLQYDHFLAKSSVVTGTLLFFLSLSWGAILLHRQFKNLE